MEDPKILIVVANKLNVELQQEALIRIGQVSDGFAHYVHPVWSAVSGRIPHVIRHRVVQKASSKSFASCVMLSLVRTYGYARLQPKELAMSVQLLIVYPPPNDPAKFDRAYREEHLPYAGPRLLGATGVTTKRVLGAPGGAPFAHTISFVEFPSAEIAKTCAQSKGGQEALAHAASISTGGPPQFLLVEDAG